MGNFKRGLGKTASNCVSYKRGGGAGWDLGRENRSKGRAYGELSWISCILSGTSNQRGPCPAGSFLEASAG